MYRRESRGKDTPPIRRLRRIGIAAVLGFTMVGFAAAGMVVAAQQLPPRPVGAPVRTPPPELVEKAGNLPPPPAALLEQQRREHKNELIGTPRVYDIAVESRGKPVTIAGRQVPLPPDAYVSGILSHVLCDPARLAELGKTCPETPALIIKRGNSTIIVGIASGQVSQETIAPGEERTFDFLRGVARR